MTLAGAMVYYSQMLKLRGYLTLKSDMQQHIRESSDHPCPGIYRRLLGFLKTT